MPFIRDALEMVHASIAELEAGACHQISHRTGDHYLIGIRGGRDARADVDRDADHLIARQLAFPGMQARADLEAECMDMFTDRSRTADRPRRAIECSE